jgi:glycosyltransferase involved in cell wall biosynthesis
LAESEADRDARLATIGDLGQRLADVNQRLDASKAVQAAQSAFIARQEELLNDTVARLQTISASRFFKLLRRFGWRESPKPDENMNGLSDYANSGTHDKRKLKRVVVDLTPVLPGGKNGGAKLVATQLVKNLARLAPEIDFELLTAENNHAELAALEGANVHRVLTSQGSTTQGALLSAYRWAEQIALRFPRPIRRGISAWTKGRLSHFDSFRTRLRSARMAIRGRKHIGQKTGDLLFCPFTAPSFHIFRRPTVSIVYDLQYLYYPYFFEDEDRFERDRTFRDACRLSSKLICISDFVRTTVLQNSNLDPERVITIHIGLDSYLCEPAPDANDEILGRYGLSRNGYLIYPANFWRHKNHAMLLTAFGMYRHRHPNSELKLVCSGSLEPGAEHFAEVSRKMGLGEHVVFPGYLPDGEFAILLHGSRALIFPSLFEGFGIPLLEAMAAGKPVLCSNLTSLPEIAGDAALLFDPRKPEEIAAAIERIMFDEKLASNLIERGRVRYSLFPDVRAMAERYLRVFRETVAAPDQVHHGLEGVFSDHWTHQRVLINLAECGHPRLLEIQLSGAAWWPPSGTTGTLSNTNGSNRFVIRRGQTLTICDQISTMGGLLELSFDRVFQPRHFGLEGDDRNLGPLLTACRLLSPEGTEDLLGT